MKGAEKLFRLAVLKKPKLFRTSMVVMNSPEVNEDLFEKIGAHPSRIAFCDGALQRYLHLLDKTNKDIYWVGDFDSSDKDLKIDNINVHLKDCQDNNDLGKALDLLEELRKDDNLKKSSVEYVLVNGTTGGRFDHQM